MTDLSLWATEEARRIAHRIVLCMAPEDVTAPNPKEHVHNAACVHATKCIAAALTSAILKEREERWIKIEGEPDTSKAPWDENSILICHAATRPHCVAAAYYEPSKKFPDHPWRVEDSEHRYHRNWPTHWMPLPAHPAPPRTEGK